MNSEKQASPFAGLNEKTLKYLCFLAYHGEAENFFRTSLDTAYRKHYKLTKTACDQMATDLVAGGFAEGRTAVKQRWHIKILKELYANHPQWAGEFSLIAPNTRDKGAEYLCQIVRHIIAGNHKAAATVPRPFIGINHQKFNLLNYLQGDTEDSLQFMRLLNDEEMHEMMDETLENLLINDEITSSILDDLEQMVDSSSPFKDELKDEIAAYRFFMYGTPFKPSDSNSLWAKGVEGIKMIYAGKINDSLDAFRAALKFEPRHSTAFRNPILSYAYGIALYRATKLTDSKSIKKQLDDFLRDTNVAYKDLHFCIRMMLGNLDCAKEDYDLERAGYITSRHNEKLYNSFAYLLYHLFDLPVDNYTKDTLHSAAILQHEMSVYLPIGPIAKREFSTQFGGLPLLGTLRKKSSWELAFSEIEAALSTALPVEKRVAYYLKGYNLGTIVEQTYQEGEWVDGKTLSPNLMVRDGYESMDDTDAIIANRLNAAASYEKAAHFIVPLLADSGRLYWSNFYNDPQGAITVHHEAPRLSFEGKGETINITSNVALDHAGTVKRNTLTYLGSGEYRLITTTALQIDVMSRFLGLRDVPSSALAGMKKAIDSLKDIVEVDKGDIEQLTQPAIQSKGVLAIRITPNKGLYEISVMAKTAENGIRRFVPADGDELVYDEVDGITHCINRDFSAELDNYTNLYQYINDESVGEFESYTEGSIATAEGLLKLMSFAYDHPNQYYLEWPEGRPLKFKGEIKQSDIEISVASNINWFSVDGEVKNEELDISLEELIKSCCDSQMEGFVRIGNDEYFRMTEQLKKHIAALDVLPSHGGMKSVPKYQVGVLASMIGDLALHKDNAYSEFEQKTKDAYAIEAPIPEGLNATLRDYQVDGFRWICRLSAWGAGACLADDMGLGKTLQAITFLLHKSGEGPSLVVAPKSVLPNWTAELHRFAPSLKVININSESNREKALSKAQAGSVVLCTYGVLGTQGELLAEKPWNVVCLDEAHQIKNRNTIASRAVMQLNAANRLILTGTPLQNNLGELWNLFQFINPGLLGTWSAFHDTYMVAELNDEHRHLLKETTRPFILRRTKQEVLHELPEKIIQEQMVELSDNEMKVYEEMRRKAELKFKKVKDKKEKEDAKKLNLNFFSELMKLRQAACSMKLVHEQWTQPSSKITELLRIIDELTANPDNNIIVFSQFTSLLDLVKPELEKRGLEYLYLDGQTPLEKRQQYVDDFQKGRCRLFLSSLKAGGLGVNLTAANYVILLDPWWNPAIENQAMDRAHRLGQQRAVTVIRLISAQTIEEKILHLHDDKQHLTDDILEGTGESSKLTYEDVMDMVSPF